MKYKAHIGEVIIGELGKLCKLGTIISVYIKLYKLLFFLIINFISTIFYIFTFIDVKNPIFYKRDQWKILGLPLTERVYTMFGVQ